VVHPVKLSVVIPCYNERDTIAELLARVLAVPIEKEVIIIDDGSTDGTSELLQQLQEPGVRVFRQLRNLGKAAAVAAGFRHVRGDVVVIQDADLEYDPGDYLAMLAPIAAGTADVVYGVRFQSGLPSGGRYFWHGVGNRFLTGLSNLVSDLDISDMETGFKMFRSEVLSRLVIRSSRFGVEPELTAKFARLGCRIVEVPVHYEGRSYEAGKKIGWRDAIHATLGIFYFRFFD
jgi:glycosyltransferase involved in cell wall biosynthesis